MRFLLWILLNTPASATPDEARRGHLQKAVMPGLAHRLEVTTERLSSTDTYFAGEIALSEAWPELEGGYTALRQALAVMQSTADRHLWVVAFRRRIRLDPLSPQAISDVLSTTLPDTLTTPGGLWHPQVFAAAGIETAGDREHLSGTVSRLSTR